MIAPDSQLADPSLNNVLLVERKHLGRRRKVHMAATLSGTRAAVGASGIASPLNRSTRVAHSAFSSTRSRLLDAIQYGTQQTVTSLLKDIPKLVQVADNRGCTPLHYAAWSGRPEIIQIFSQTNAAVFEVQDHSGNTPLHHSTADTARELLSENINIETRNLQGVTALNLAAKFGEIDKVQVLLDANADVRAQDKLRNTPLHYAAWIGDSEMVELLLERGADINATNKSGLTPMSFLLSMTSPIESHEIVSLLLRENANVHITDLDGNTATHHATINQDSEVLKLLLEAGGDIKSPNSKGLTVWDLAQRSGRREIKRTILEVLGQNFVMSKVNISNVILLICDPRSACCAA